MAFVYKVNSESEEEYEKVFPPDRQPTVEAEANSSSSEGRCDQNKTLGIESEDTKRGANTVERNENFQPHLIKDNLVVVSRAQTSEFILSGALKGALIADFSRRFANPVSLHASSLATDTPAAEQASGEEILNRVMDRLENIPVKEMAQGK